MGGELETRFSKTKDFLEDSYRIGALRTRSGKHGSSRCVVLRSQDIFTSLTHLYSHLFETHWHHLGMSMASFPPPEGVRGPLHAARNYISTWFLDLYTCNRSVVFNISALTFSKHFHFLTPPCLYEYDAFLADLNASVRPTRIIHTIDDTIYVPLMAERADWTQHPQNPFGIDGFTPDENMVYTLVQAMKESGKWNFSPITTAIPRSRSATPLGRPSWLFDWHGEDEACAWFDSVGNFTLEDVAVAYVVGVACTPLLGPRDVDDWQFFPSGGEEDEGVVLQRVVPRRFFGSYEVRTVERIPSSSPARENEARGSLKRRREGEERDDGTEAPSGYKVRVTDWYYNLRVILDMDLRARLTSLRTISESGYM